MNYVLGRDFLKRAFGQNFWKTKGVLSPL